MDCSVGDGCAAPVFVLAGQGVAFSVTLIAVSVAALIACKLMFGRKAEG